MYKTVKDQVVILGEQHMLYSLSLSKRCSSELVIKFRLVASKHTQKKGRKKRDGRTQAHVYVCINSSRCKNGGRTDDDSQSKRKNNNTSMLSNSIHILCIPFSISFKTCLSRCGCSFFLREEKNYQKLFFQGHIFLIGFIPLLRADEMSR